MHPQIAEFEAQRHCNQFGKTAVLVETMPVRPSVETLFTRSSQSVFRCVLWPFRPSTLIRLSSSEFAATARLPCQYAASLAATARSRTACGAEVRERTSARQR